LLPLKKLEENNKENCPEGEFAFCFACVLFKIVIESLMGQQERRFYIFYLFKQEKKCFIGNYVKR